MLDHIGVIVSDIEKSKRFYAEALKPIGYALSPGERPKRPGRIRCAPEGRLLDL